MNSPTSFNREPLWWIAGGQAIIQAIFVLLASFNVQITSAQQAAITGLFIVLGTAWGRSKVFAPIDKEGNPVTPTGIPMKPATDEYADILANSHPESTTKTQEQLLAEYRERLRKYGNLPPPIVKAAD